jgi:hypothetical protein
MRCPSCGLLRFVAGLCSHEKSTYDGNWSDGNRAACDFFHRQIVRTQSPRTPTPAAEASRPRRDAERTSAR